jgi:hypothetical protein
MNILQAATKCDILNITKLKQDLPCKIFGKVISDQNLNFMNLLQAITKLNALQNLYPANIVKRLYMTENLSLDDFTKQLLLSENSSYKSEK